MGFYGNHFPEVLDERTEQHDDCEPYTPTPDDYAEYLTMTRQPDLSGLEALVAQLEDLATNAADNAAKRARGPAERHEYKGLATAYTNAAAWLRQAAAKLEA